MLKATHYIGQSFPAKSKESFPRLPKETVLQVTNTSGDSTLINLDPSHDDKFVTQTRDQPEPGSFFPCSLWGGEMKDPGYKVARRQILWQFEANRSLLTARSGIALQQQAKLLRMFLLTGLISSISQCETRMNETAEGLRSQSTSM